MYQYSMTYPSASIFHTSYFWHLCSTDIPDQPWNRSPRTHSKMTSPSHREHLTLANENRILPNVLFTEHKHSTPQIETKIEYFRTYILPNTNILLGKSKKTIHTIFRSWESSTCHNQMRPTDCTTWSSSDEYRVTNIHRNTHSSVKKNKKSHFSPLIEFKKLF